MSPKAAAPVAAPDAAPVAPVAPAPKKKAKPSYSKTAAANKRRAAAAQRRKEANRGPRMSVAKHEEVVAQLTSQLEQVRTQRNEFQSLLGVRDARIAQLDKYIIERLIPFAK